ncbi:MAG: hypothetical protein LOD91_00610 [Limnochordales bacterium]|nr:hypothetical protein [Limnochordales bacterium]
MSLRGATAVPAPRIDWTRLSIGLALLMLVYFTITNHVDLYPLNNLGPAGPQWPSTLAGWIQFVIFIALMATRRRLAVLAALVIAVVWISLQFRQWYFPYLFNIGPVDWYFHHGYADTLKVLPPIPGHAVTPDLQHNLLQLLSLSVAAAAIMAVRQSFWRA